VRAFIYPIKERYAEVVVHDLDKQTGTSSWSLVKASPIFFVVLPVSLIAADIGR
jgi:hypothetical protein